MGTVTILKETPKNPITLIGERAGVCYNSDISDPEKNYKRGIGCIKSGHGRVLEFVNIHMILDGSSARVIREYMRHVGGGLSVLQASTRYIDYTKDFSYVVPKSIQKDLEAREKYISLMLHISKELKQLKEAYDIPHEDLANALPLGMTTKLVDNKNLRNLIDMSHTRKCTCAYWEFRELFQDICDALTLYSDEWGYLVMNYFIPKCEVTGYCDEGKRSCGKKPLKGEL